MKNLSLKTPVVLLLAVTALYLQSCKTRSFTTTFLEPADITIPQHIKSVGVLNRSLPDKQDLLLSRSLKTF